MGPDFTPLPSTRNSGLDWLVGLMPWHLGSEIVKNHEVYCLFWFQQVVWWSFKGPTYSVTQFMRDPCFWCESCGIFLLCFLLTGKKQGRSWDADEKNHEAPAETWRTLRDLGFLPVMPLAFTQAKCQVVVSSRALNEEAKELKWGSKETFGRTSLMARVMISGAWPISLQSAGDVLFTVQDVLYMHIYEHKKYIYICIIR